MRLIFWQQLPSPHQAPFIREVAARLGPGAVTCVFSSSPERPSRPLGFELGWQQGDLDYGLTEVVHLRGNGLEAAARLSTPKDSVHIFSSVASDPTIRAAYREVVRHRRSIGILSEARDWRGWKGMLRRADSLRHERAWRSEVSFVLGMGSIGCRWYELCGYDSDRLFDFCYVVEKPSDPVTLADEAADFRVAFVGQLIRRKRVDLLLHVIAGMQGRGVSVDIVGAGPLEGRLRNLAQELQLQDAVRFLGGLRNTDVSRVLSGADVLVLPSDWDGWGAVVNEALFNGARVVCSDFCGASDLVTEPRLGAVFRGGSVDSLAKALDGMRSRGKVSSEERASIRAHSSSFAGPAVAEYLLQVVAWSTEGVGTRPVAPWRGRAGGVE